MKNVSTQSGFALVFMIIVVGAVSMSVSLLLAKQAWSANRHEQATLASLTARYVAEGCLEHGLLQVRDDDSFEGTLDYTVAGIDCVVEVIDEGGDVRRLTVTSVQGDYQRQLEAVTYNLSPQIEARLNDTSDF